MREIKFRAWHNAAKCFVSDDLVSLSLSGRVVNDAGDSLDGNRFEVTQFTSRSDVNGRDIYEGDLIKQSGSIYQVVYSTHAAAFVLEDATGYCVDLLSDCPTPEIVGNIYENAELLK
jgi:hypothetical protein